MVQESEAARAPWLTPSVAGIGSASFLPTLAMKCRRRRFRPLIGIAATAWQVGALRLAALDRAGSACSSPQRTSRRHPARLWADQRLAARRQLQYIRRLDTPGLHDSYADRSAAIGAPWKKKPPQLRGLVEGADAVCVSVRSDDDASCVVATTTASDSPDAGDSCCDGSGANQSFLQTIADE